jgi:hypothetical protein
MLSINCIFTSQPEVISESSINKDIDAQRKMVAKGMMINA